MSPKRRCRQRPIALRPACEPLERREVPSGLGIPSSLQLALQHGIANHGIKTSPAGISAIESALHGGAGSEFVNLIHKEVGNPTALLGKFTSGALTTATIRGAAARKATILSTFTGAHYDYQAIVATGALVQPSGTLELGAILRGPNRSTAPAYYVFGIDRGDGAALGPLFPSESGITPDALVTITLGPNNSNPTGTIADLTDGATTAIGAGSIQAKGSTLRVFVPTSDLPSKGLPVSSYRFAFWTQDQPADVLGNVGSFLPQSSMIAVGQSTGGGLKL
jgi:hypothetical protein